MMMELHSAAMVMMVELGNYLGGQDLTLLIRRRG
jgi:hypothetical protein